MKAIVSPSKLHSTPRTHHSISKNMSNDVEKRGDKAKLSMNSPSRFEY
jgi:hypothetical protein